MLGAFSQHRRFIAILPRYDCSDMQFFTSGLSFLVTRKPNTIGVFIIELLNFRTYPCVSIAGEWTHNSVPTFGVCACKVDCSHFDSLSRLVSNNSFIYLNAADMEITTELTGHKPETTKSRWSMTLDILTQELSVEMGDEVAHISMQMLREQPWDKTMTSHMPLC
jgi:hypothetical protein